MGVISGYRTPFKISLLTLLILLTFLPCLATDLSWTYENSGGEINDIAIGPDGSYVTAGAGKVILISGDGTVLAKEPYGDIIRISRDGSAVCTAYSSSLNLFRIAPGNDNKLTLQKRWETSLPGSISSIAISDKGGKVVASVVGGGVYTYDGTSGKPLGSSTKYSSLISISGSGTTITGISGSQGLNIYSTNGKFVKSADISITETPKSFFLTQNGKIAIFNDAQRVYAIRASNGSSVWETRATGEVNMLASTPDGSGVIAGTKAGSIDRFDSNGTLLWTYDVKNGTESRLDTTAVAISQDGSRILAGFDNGNIILLDADGIPQMQFKTTDNIRKVAIAADGSLAVAASESTIYAFKTSNKMIPKKTTTMTFPVTRDDYPSEESAYNITSEGVTTAGVDNDIPPTSRIIPPEYSVIKTSSKSPISPLISILTLFIACLIYSNYLNRQM